MRTPRHFLGFFTFALILPMLLLACSGSDEPTSVPSTAAPTTERAEPSPTPVATVAPIPSPTPVATVAPIPTSAAEPTKEGAGSSPTPMATVAPTPTSAAEPTKEGAEPSPTPMATVAPTPTSTAAPTLAATAVPPQPQTSTETDREALVALYNATDGPNWYRNDNWLSEVPIGEWLGITADDNGRVTELNLDGNELSGAIPPELGDLANLTVLSLSGAMPELGCLSNLRSEPRRERVKRGDTAGAGRPRQLDGVVPP